MTAYDPTKGLPRRRSDEPLPIYPQGSDYAEKYGGPTFEEEVRALLREILEEEDGDADHTSRLD